MFAGVGLGIVLMPYWVELIRHPIQQMPIPHASRSNLLLNATYFTNYFLVPYGMLVIALPFILWYGSANRRLRPLLFGFWVTFIFGLGGTTPIPKLLLGRAFDVLTFERFTLSAALMTLPIVGLLAERAMERSPRRAALGFAAAAIITLALPMAWIAVTPFSANASLNVDAVDNFVTERSVSATPSLKSQPIPTPTALTANTTQRACCLSSRVTAQRSSPAPSISAPTEWKRCG